MQDVESGGEQAARDYAVRFDHWKGDIVVAAADRERAVAGLPQKLKDDIAFAHDNVSRFADAQRAAILDTEVELMPGLVAGHRNIPVATAGCYVPGGRYTHLASAIMSVTTAKVAGVQHVIAACPPRPDVGINPAVLYAQRMTREANRKIATIAARISRLEGMEAHARTSDIRLAKWFPSENFDLSAAE